MLLETYKEAMREAGKLLTDGPGGPGYAAEGSLFQRPQDTQPWHSGWGARLAFAVRAI